MKGGQNKRMNQLIREQILSSLEELSDRQVQEDLWMGKIPSQQGDFVEAVECLFTDSGLSDLLLAEQTEFSEKARLTLNDLLKQLAKVSSTGGPREVINDPAMKEVRLLAARALELLKNEWDERNSNE
jgi:hypothetical protein